MRTRLLVSAALVLCSLPVLGQAAVQTPEEVFMAKFAEAVKADNYAIMKDLIVKNDKKTIFNGYMIYEYQLCSAVSNKNDDDKTARLGVIDKLANFANQELKSRFYLDRLVWVKALTPEQAAKRMQIGDLNQEAFGFITRAEKSGEKQDWTGAQAKFEKTVPLTQEIKDVYFQIDGNVWLGYICEKLGLKFETAYYLKRAMEIGREEKAIAQIAEYDVAGKLKRATKDGLRDDVIDVTIPLEDSRKKYTAEMEKRAADALNPAVAAGTASKPAGAPGAPGGKVALPTALPPMANKHTMRNEWADAEKPKYEESVGRPILTANVRANGPWYNWYTFEVAPGATGSKLGVLPGEHVFKNDKGKLLFDPDGAGKAPEEKMKIAVGKPELTVFKGRAFPDGSKVDVHHLVMMPPTAFTVNGVGLSFKAPGPTDKIPLAFQGASAVTTKFAGNEITIYDDNCNGEFSNYGEDSIIVGKGKTAKAMPLSRYLHLGDLLFEVKLDPNGQNIRFKPYDGPIALLQFDWVGASNPAFMILEGQNENQQVYFNLMDCKDKPMWVPPGEYKFKSGYFCFGEGANRETFQVLNTKCTSFKVSEGQLNKVQMGGAKAPGFTCIWKAEQEKDKGKTVIRIHGKDIKIFGCAGEEYAAFFTGQFRPTVKMKAGKDGAVFYDKEMRPSGKEDATNGKFWGDVLLYPKDLEIEKTASGDVMVQLEGEYPKLGKITSTPSKVE